MEPDRTAAPPVVGVVVVHEVDDWFEESLRALATQDYPNVRWLFLVTADGRLEELRERIQAVIPAAFVRRSATDGSFGAAVNEVLDLVEGDQGFFWICHDDVAPARDALRHLVTELYRSNAGMVGPKLVEWDEPRRLQHVGLGLDRFGEVDPVVEPGELDQEQHDAVRDVFVLPSASILIRADLFRALGGFDPDITFHGDDVDLCWRAHLSGARVVVAPDARVRHRELLEVRRPDLDHRRLRERHRMRAVATLTGRSRLAVRSLELVLLTVVEVIAGLFTGRFGDGLASLRALIGLVPRTGRIVARRRAVAPTRQVPEREVLGLQDRGSARLTSYVRGRETTTYLGVDSTVRRWRPTTYAPLLAWFLVLAALVIGSRTFIDRGVPQVGEFLAFPDSARSLVGSYLSSWDPRAGGSVGPVPTGWMSLALLSTATWFRMELAMTVAVIAMAVVGAAGAWRLSTVFPATSARVAALVVYVGTPLVPGLFATGRWSALVWYAALPWALHLARRVAGIGTADPDLLDADLVDGVAELSPRERVRHLAALSLVLGLAAAFVPVVVPLWLLVGLAVVVATVVVRGSVATATWFAVATFGGGLVAAIVNLPWSGTWTWSGLVPVPAAGGAADGLVDTAALALDDRPFVVLAIALYVPMLVALAISRAWRLTWAVRGAALVTTFGALAVFADRGDLPFDPPDVALLMVPMALGLSLCAAAVAGGFSTDVRSRGFGWRQPAALLANVAIVIGIIPAAVSIGNGSWGAPRNALPGLLAAQLPADPVDGDYRVLYVGDPRVVPVPSFPYADGVGYAIVDDGALSFTDRWAAPTTSAATEVGRALEEVAAGSTLRAGRLLAPYGIRYVVVPEIDGAASTAARPIPLPDGLLDALRDQLDLGETFGAPGVTVFVNRSWIPVTARLGGVTAQASRDVAGPAALARSDLSIAEPVLPGASDRTVVEGPVRPGRVHVSVPAGTPWWLEVDGARVDPTTSFGVVTAFDVVDAGEPTTDVRLGYDGAASRTVWVVVQTLLWLVVAGAATRARVGRSRRRDADVTDETLIHLEDELVDDPGTVLGAVDPMVRTAPVAVIGESLDVRWADDPDPPAASDDGEGQR